MTNTVQNGSRHTQNPVHISTNNLSEALVSISPGAAKPTTIEILDGQPSNTPIQEYDAPKVVKQPKRHRRVRMLTDVAKNECPLVQAGDGKTQRAYIETEVINCILVFILKKQTFLIEGAG
jgi:hypothetical protein